MPKKTPAQKPYEIPAPGEIPEINPNEIPEYPEPLVEDPEATPDEDPFENPPPSEIPPPGEGP